MTEYSLPIQINVDGEVQTVAFSPNGKRLVDGDEEAVRVWRVEDGQHVATMEARGIVNCLAVSQDDHWIAAGTHEGDISVWNAKKYYWLQVVWKEDYSILGVDFSPDSMRLVASGNRMATVWDVGTRKQVQTLKHEKSVAAAKYSPDGDRIATATEDQVRVWDSNDGRLLVEISAEVTPLQNAGLLWSNNHIFVVLKKKIKEIDASTGTAISEWHFDSGVCDHIAIPKHGKFVVPVTGRTISFWNPSNHLGFCRVQHSKSIQSIVFSPDDRFIAFGAHKQITILSLSHVFHSIQPLIHPNFTEVDVRIGSAILDAWKHGYLEDADALLTDALAASQHLTDQVLACRALVRTRLRQLAEALVDAEKAIEIQPSVIGYIAKSMAYVVNGERHKSLQACDIAFEHCHSSHVTFLLLIKAIIIFMTGDHIDAISRVDDLIGTVHHKSILYAVQAYMHLLRGNAYMVNNSYESATKSFERARTQLQHYSGEQPLLVMLISGWKFDDLYITIYQRLCEALYSVGRTKDANQSLLELMHALEKDSIVRKTVVNWVSDFTKRCLSTPESDTDAVFMGETRTPMPDTKSTPLLKQWAKATLMGQSWKDALVDAASFAVPKFVVYRAICECLQETGRITDASECLLEMASEMVHESNTENTKQTGDLKHWCGRELEDLGDNAMSVRKHDMAIVRYSAALALNLPSSKTLFVKRSKGHANKGSWEEALKDANEAIALDPSFPLGYERKHAALRGGGRYADAKVAFDTMISKMSDSADLEMRERSRRYVKPSQTEAAIRAAIEDATRESPLMLINTDSGRLLDKHGQASSFMSQPIFHELVSSITTDIDRVRIENEVDQYYRYAMFSHKWKANEPLFDQVVHIVVYDLEESPTHTKLQMFCEIARDAGLHWAWSDTCCINKGDPSVLQEALVSMFQWYQTSTLTVVSLCDVPSKRLGDSIWNSRAWTFQEYHASKVVRFYNKDWTLYRNINVPNHKESPEIIAEMEAATGISAQALMALQPGLEDIREKLRLASARQTTRIEDSAYSLLGIFSLSLSAVYGEGDRALGRLLAQLLTSSGDTSILAWTGRSSSFNSCLPAEISVFSRLPTTHIPPALTSTKLDTICAGLRSLNRASVARLHDALGALPLPLFNGKRLKLPSVVFKLGDLSDSRSGTGHVFRGQTDALGVVEIKAKEDLSRIKPLYLVHPWIDFLLDQQPVGSVAEMIPEEASDEQSSVTGDPPASRTSPSATSLTPPTRTGLTSRLGLSFGRRLAAHVHDTASLRPPSTLAPSDRQLHALRVLARLSQPFGALLLTPDSRNVAAYKRVAAESLITIQVPEITPRILDKLIDSVRVLDVL